MKEKSPAKKVKNTNTNEFLAEPITTPNKVISNNFIDTQKLAEFLKKATPAEKELIDNMISIALSTTREEEFWTFNERLAMNSLKRLFILV